MTPEQIEAEAKPLVQQLDGVLEQIQDATLILTGTLSLDTLEEARLLVRQSAWTAHESHVRLAALVAKVRAEGSDTHR